MNRNLVPGSSVTRGGRVARLRRNDSIFSKHVLKFSEGENIPHGKVSSPSQLGVRSCGPSNVLMRRPRTAISNSFPRQTSAMTPWAMLVAGELVDTTGAAVHGAPNGAWHDRLAAPCYKHGAP